MVSNLRYKILIDHQLLLRVESDRNGKKGQKEVKICIKSFSTRTFKKLISLQCTDSLIVLKRFRFWRKFEYELNKNCAKNRKKREKTSWGQKFCWKKRFRCFWTQNTAPGTFFKNFLTNKNIFLAQKSIDNKQNFRHCVLNRKEPKSKLSLHYFERCFVWSNLF